MGSIAAETNLKRAEKLALDHYKAKDVEIKLTELPADKDENGTVFKKETNEISLKKARTFVFVLGAPGCGKSTQCAKLAHETGYTHLSIGDLLRKAAKYESKNGLIMESQIKNVPADVTMKILLKAIEESGNDKFLLDGFPRDEKLRSAFEAAIDTEPELVMFFDFPEEIRAQRILSRNQGRVDDNMESLSKRVQRFKENTIPIVEYYRSKGKVTKIDAAKPIEKVYETLRRYFNTKPTVKTEELGFVAEFENKISK